MKQQRPATADEGKGQILIEAIKRFDRGDGTGADWRLMVESLFKAGFEAVKHLTTDERATVLRRVHEGAYNRMTTDEDNESRKDASGGGLAPSNIAPSTPPAPRPKS